MEKKQSSVDWLVSQLKISTYWNSLISELELMECGEIDILEQAKEMHKNEIEETFFQGAYGGDIISAEQYYNETYGGEKQC